MADSRRRDWAFLFGAGVVALVYCAALILCCSRAPAQVVRACNYGTATFAGWHRTTTDTLPPHYRGMSADGLEYAAGKAVGLLGYVCDVRLNLPPGTGVKFDLGTGKAVDGDDPKVPVDVAGAPVVAGGKLQLLDALVDGAGTDFHWRGRPWPAAAPMLTVDAWATWYPGQSWAVGELVVTASNPAVLDLVATVPPGGLTLGWSSGLAVVDGLPWNTPLLAGGETLGNSQSRAWRFVCGLGGGAIADVQSALGESAAAIAVIGISKPGLLGGFAAPPLKFDPVGWAHERLPKARAALHTWDILRDSRGGSVGVSPRSGDTGDQEDQPGVCKGVEETASPWPGPYWVSYYAAMGQLRRPDKHLEADGSLLAWMSHPDLSLWVSQPNFPDTAATDHLGKPRMVQLGSETHAWEGADTEHDFLGRLAQALQWTASPALQWYVQNKCRVFLFTETLDPRFATTQITDASRAWAWEALIAAWCYELSDDRQIANAVRQREHDRAQLVYARFGWVNRPAEWFDVRNDARINDAIGGGFTLGTLAYQQGMAGLMQVAGEVLGDAVLVEWAGRLAQTATSYGWTQDAQGRWIAWDMVGVHPDGSPLPTPYVEGQGAHRTGFFDTTWFAPGVWTVLRQDPTNTRAKAIYAQLLATPTTAPNQPIRTNDWILPIGAARAVTVVSAVPVSIAPVK